MLVEWFVLHTNCSRSRRTDRVYAPAGLDLGSDTPYQIVHSIVGETLAVANGREPRHLRDREGPIHAHIEP